MAYLDDIRNLMELTQAGADPMGMFGEFQQLKDEREARIQARKQAEAEAQAGALDSLMGYAFQAAGSPQNLKDVLRMAGAEQAFPTDPQGALDSLFYPAGGRNAGLSRIDPQLPPDAEADIARIVEEETLAGTPPSEIQRIVEQALGYGPRVTSDLHPQIDPLVQSALKAGY